MERLETLAEYCGKIFAEELAKDLMREKTDPNYLPQRAFPDHRSRMQAVRYNATVRVDNLTELLNLKHREVDHEEDNTVQITTLEATMPVEDLEASVLIWWKS